MSDDLEIKTFCREPGIDSFRHGMEEILANDTRKWLTFYAPEPAVEQKRCSWCSETPCNCDHLDALDRGEDDVMEGDDWEGAK